MVLGVLDVPRIQSLADRCGWRDETIRCIWVVRLSTTYFRWRCRQRPCQHAFSFSNFVLSFHFKNSQIKRTDCRQRRRIDCKLNLRSTSRALVDYRHCVEWWSRCRWCKNTCFVSINPGTFEFYLVNLKSNPNTQRKI